MRGFCRLATTERHESPKLPNHQFLLANRDLEF